MNSSKQIERVGSARSASPLVNSRTEVLQKSLSKNERKLDSFLSNNSAVISYRAINFDNSECIFGCI